MKTRCWGVAALALLASSGCESPPTYARDVAPILASNCASCHRPGQGAPFSLLTYSDAQSRAGEIADATARRQMPPWLPEPGEPAFVGARRLRPADIETLQRWADTGAARGDDSGTPQPASSADSWALGTPDLVVQPERAFHLAAGDDDVFRNLVVRVPVPSGGGERFVRAVEFRPGDAPVHHAVVHLDRTAASRQRDGDDGQPGFDGMGAAGTQEPEGHFIGWAPGRGPIVSAEGRPWRLERGTDLVLELHLIPGAAGVAVRPTVGIYFSESPQADAPLMLKMGSKAIDIPAGATDYAISDDYELPADITLLSIYPHAHYLGKEMQVRATLPNGSTRLLLHIRQWDFHWQQDYRFAAPVSLPRGTTIGMRFTYDNSAGNPANPSQPPVRVMAGPRSTDEMGNVLLQIVPASAADRARLQADAVRREAAANVAIAEQMVRTLPASADNLTFLGASYVDVGRIADGIASIGKALQLDPNSWNARNELGGALLKAGRFADAVREFRQAVRLNPTDARVQFNLGKALAAAGAIADSIAAFRRAVSLNAEFAEAHEELGVALFARGRLQEAIGHLQKAVALSPGWALAHSDLGGALAQAGRVEDARRHLERALVLEPGNADARANLARLPRGRT